jgi:hypothetical protein
MKLAYIHSPEGRKTISIELPTAEALKAVCLYELTRKHGKPVLSLKMGISKVHPDDRYSRKTGRTVADGRLATVSLEIFSFGVTDKEIKLLTYHRSSDTTFLFKVYRDTGKVRVF